MRIVAAILIWVVLVGGVSLYMERREQITPPPEYVRPKAPGIYALDVTASFSVEPDPFAVQLDEKDAPVALLLRMGEKELVRRTEKLEAGSLVAVDPIEGVVVGKNEFYIEANPPTEQLNRSHAVRVRIQRDGETVADRTFWTDPGSKLATAFVLEVAPDVAKEDDHGHDH